VPRIVVVRSRIEPTTLAMLVGDPFEGMVKFVADVDRRILAVGGELHVDAEAVLLEEGSRQDALWGGNYYPGKGPEGCLQYTSLINIRPSQANRGMEVADPAVRDRMREIVFALVGRGEPLP
jgi:hypothetical protein